MANSPPRQCPKPSCKYFCPCPIHSGVDKRENSSKRGYDSKWERVRKHYLAEHPIAECDRCPIKDCNVDNEPVRADMIHHIKPIKTHPELRLVRENLLAINQRLCHSKIENYDT